MMHRIIAVDCFPVKRHVKGIIHSFSPPPLNALFSFPFFLLREPQLLYASFGVMSS